MKQPLLFAVLLLLFGCAKEKPVEPVSGTWTIVETNIGTGTGYTVQNYSPSSEITVEFGPNGNLLLFGKNPGTAMSPLWNFDKYELRPDNKVRFYQSVGTVEMEAFLTLNGDLFLNYMWARCGYEEKFVRIK